MGTGTNTFDFKRLVLIPLDRERLAAAELTGPARDELAAQVEEALVAGPFTVVREKRLAPSGDPHDYTSIAAYFWPNPDTADGLPWVCRDGEINPERDDGDCIPLFRLCGAVRTLCLGHLLLGDARCAPRIELLLESWFLDPGTRMNPHLEYTQAVPGVHEGTCWGLIDTNLLPGMHDGLDLLGSAIDPVVVAELRPWFHVFGRWFVASDLGREEAAMPNNHATWHLVESVAFLAFGRKADEALERLRERAGALAVAHVDADGAQPHELARTLSFDYSAYNLAGLCHLAVQHERLELGGDAALLDAIRRATAFFLPFVDGKEWTHQQIKPVRLDSLIPVLHWAGRLCGEAAFGAKAVELMERFGWNESYRGALYGG